MLACRPMLSFAAAVVAGSVVARFAPAAAMLLGLGWLLWFGFAGCFFLSRPASGPDVSGSVPGAYSRHIVPVPGFFAARGLNRFVLLLCGALFLVAVGRQRAWRESLARERMPASLWFDAVFLALAPARDHGGDPGKWRVPGRLLSVDGSDVPPVDVMVYGAEGEDFRRGDLVSARVRRSPDRPKAYPGAFDAPMWLERSGLAGSLSVVRARGAPSDAPAYAVVADDSPPMMTRMRRWIDFLRGRAIALTLERGGESGAALAAMLYGYRRELGEDLRDAFRRVGIGHVLAISGLHVGLVVGLLWWLSGWFGWSSRPRAVACLFLALVYLGLSGGQVAASRATLMAVIHLGAVACGRRGDMLNSLGAAACILVLVTPSAPFDVSFQLSFTAVVFIHLALARLPGAKPPPASGRIGFPPARRIRREIRSLVRLSLSTWLGLFPIIALVFNQTNLVGLPVNVVVIPLMSLVLAGGLLLPAAGWVPGAAWLFCLPERLLARIAFFADSLPYSSFPCHPPSGAWIAVFYLAVFLFLARDTLPPHSPLRRWWRAGAGIFAAIAFAGLLASMGGHPPPPAGRIALLPGASWGTVVAESPEGGVAVLGSPSRGGRDAAGWLHHLHRSGPVAVLAIGGDPIREGSFLDWHHGITAAVAAPETEKRGGKASWLPVAGAPGVEYAVSRNARGRAVWLAVRAGERTIAVAPRVSARQFAWRLAEGVPGAAAELLAVGFWDRDVSLRELPRPAGRVAVIGGRAVEPPSGWFARSAYQTLLIDGNLLGYDGDEWLPVR